MAMQAAIQQEISAPPAKRLFNVDEYYRMGEVGIFQPGERVELIEGEIYTMAPVGKLHNSIVLRFNRIFSRLFSQQAIVSVQSPIRLNNQAEPEPDIALLRLDDDLYAQSLPAQEDVYLLVEVSGKSLPFDRNTKLPLYAQHNIPEVWIVDVNKNTIEKLTTPKNGEYTKTAAFKKGGSITVDAFPEIEVPTDSLLLE